MPSYANTYYWIGTSSGVLSDAGNYLLSDHVTPTSAVPASGDLVIFDPTLVAVVHQPDAGGTSAATWNCQNSPGPGTAVLAGTFTAPVASDGSGFLFDGFTGTQLTLGLVVTAHPGATHNDLVYGPLAVSDWISFDCGATLQVTQGGPTWNAAVAAGTIIDPTSASTGYGSLEGTQLRFGLTTVNEWLDPDETGDPDMMDARFAQAQQVVDDEIESRLRETHYRLPFVNSVGATPTLIVELANTLYGLYLKKAWGVEEYDENGQPMDSLSYDRAEAGRMLESIRTGGVNLDAL